MHDLPSQTLLQQSVARPVSGEELEVLGKQASAVFRCGSCTLNEAVIETVKKAGLSPEQVKRVCEFANTDAYLKAFEKLGATHKYISFEGGPANPSEVLKDLNDGGGGTVFDRGDGDYSNGPMSKSSQVLFERNRQVMGLQKTAGSPFDPAERAFEEMWQTENRPLPYAEPLADAFMMKDKLAAIEDQLRHDLNGTEVLFAQASEDLYQLVKDAAAVASLGHVLQVWHEVVPGPGFVKSAFALIGPRLVREEVFPSLHAMGASLEKTASRRLMVNTEHPLVTTFAAYCTSLEKLAHLREARKAVLQELDYLNGFLKEASNGGLVGKVWRGAGTLGESMSPTVGKVVGAVGGETAGKAAETVAKHAPKAALVGAGLVGAREGYERGVKYGPLGGPVNYVASLKPGSQAWLERQAQLQAGVYQ